MTQQAIIDEIFKRLGDEKPTPENIIKTGQAVQREAIHRNYPASDPKVVEALLLMYSNICFSMFFLEIAKEEDTEEMMLTRLILVMCRFGKSLDETIKTLAG
jgi:hypothetical protein